MRRMNSYYLPKYLEHFWKAECLSNHFIDWELSFCLPVPSLRSQTRTQSLFTGQIGLFQRESGLDRVEHGEIYGKRREKNDTPCALIHPSIQSALPKTHK